MKSLTKITSISIVAGIAMIGLPAISAQAATTAPAVPGQGLTAPAKGGSSHLQASITNFTATEVPGKNQVSLGGKITLDGAEILGPVNFELYENGSQPTETLKAKVSSGTFNIVLDSQKIGNANMVRMNVATDSGIFQAQTGISRPAVGVTNHEVRRDAEGTFIYLAGNLRNVPGGSTLVMENKFGATGETKKVAITDSAFAQRLSTQWPIVDLWIENGAGTRISQVITSRVSL